MLYLECGRRERSRPRRGDDVFTLDYKSRKPLYDQLCESVERMAACGVLTQGCRLPSVRVLAEELAINPNTVQKAYRMLERNGIIQTVPGKGSFLAGRDEAKRPQRPAAFGRCGRRSRRPWTPGLTGPEILPGVRGLSQRKGGEASVIELKEFTKKFDGFTALEAVSFQVEEGSIFGLVGSNGAGKSTLLRGLCGVYAPDGGKVLIDGQEPYENPDVKSRVFFVSDYPYFMPQFTLRDMADFFRRSYPNWSQEEYQRLCKLFPLDPKMKIHN